MLCTPVPAFGFGNESSDLFDNPVIKVMVPVIFFSRNLYLARYFINKNKNVNTGAELGGGSAARSSQGDKSIIFGLFVQVNCSLLAPE